MCDIEMTPSKSSQETYTLEELILTPSLSGGQTMSADLVLEAEDMFIGVNCDYQRTETR